MTGKRLLYLIPFILVVVLGFFFNRALNNDPSLLPSTRLDQKVPVFQLPTLKQPDQSFSHEQLKGPLLLNVWATWCPSCRIEHPILMELAKSGIHIVGLNYKDERTAALQYLQNHGDPFRVNIFDQNGDLGLDLGVYGAPETYLIDGNGVIRYRHVGVVSEQNWRELLWPKWQQMGGTHNGINSGG